MGVWAQHRAHARTRRSRASYLTNWDKVKLDPRGSYFSNNDAASDDADARDPVASAAARTSTSRSATRCRPASRALGAAAAALYGPFNPAASVWAPRTADKRRRATTASTASRSATSRTELNNTEFGLYYMNYHSRTPFFSGIEGHAHLRPHRRPADRADLRQRGAARAVPHRHGELLRRVSRGHPPHRHQLQHRRPRGHRAAGRVLVPLQPAAAVRRPPELILAALGLPNLITGFTQIPGAPAGRHGGGAGSGRHRTSTGYAAPEVEPGPDDRRPSRCPSLLGAEQLVLVGEVGATWFHNLPTEREVRGPGDVPAGHRVRRGRRAARSRCRPTASSPTFSWGYRLAARLDYANALYGGTLAPRLAFAHDVNGVEPELQPGHEVAVAGPELGLPAPLDRRRPVHELLRRPHLLRHRPSPPAAPSRRASRVSWCSSANPLKDRDFYSFSVSYSF